MRSARSKTVTSWPAALSWAAQARPAGPEPTTATRFPVRLTGGCDSGGATFTVGNEIMPPLKQFTRVDVVKMLLARGADVGITSRVEDLAALTMTADVDRFLAWLRKTTDHTAYTEFTGANIVYEFAFDA